MQVCIWRGLIFQLSSVTEDGSVPSFCLLSTSEPLSSLSPVSRSWINIRVLIAISVRLTEPMMCEHLRACVVPRVGGVALLNRSEDNWTQMAFHLLLITAKPMLVQGVIWGFPLFNLPRFPSFLSLFSPSAVFQPPTSAALAFVLHIQSVLSPRRPLSCWDPPTKHGTSPLKKARLFNKDQL